VSLHGEDGCSLLLRVPPDKGALLKSQGRGTCSFSTLPLEHDILDGLYKPWSIWKLTQSVPIEKFNNRQRLPQRKDWLLESSITCDDVLSDCRTSVSYADTEVRVQHGEALGSIQRIIIICKLHTYGSTAMPIAGRYKYDPQSDERQGSSG
jgi:hypothetical protein